MRDSDIEERRNGKLGIDFGRKFLIILCIKNQRETFGREDEERDAV
jgi:hypothetical protein